ncbi:MAG: HD domain-containing phosphohydrolase, partial [Dokdonella sp.]
LVGDEIPIEARIVAVADVVDALLSPRPYKPSWALDAALAYLREQSGILFDPRCVDALLRNRAKLEDICARFSSISKRPGLE